MIAVPPEPSLSVPPAVDAVVAALEGRRLSTNDVPVSVLGAHAALGGWYLQLALGQDDELVVQVAPGATADEVVAALEACVRSPRPWPHVIRVDTASGSAARRS